MRSSVARRLGLPTAGLPSKSDRQADGVVDILLDATLNHKEVLTTQRLFGWHAALFPTGYSGMHKIRVAFWRDDHNGPMQVVSGPVGREKIHYQAPPATRLANAMNNFFRWWEKSLAEVDGLLRAAVGHLRFVAIHPFEDGNGRIARALTEMALAQDENLSTRYYSLSAQIMAERKAYYQILEHTNKGDGEITEWILWFLQCMSKAILNSDNLLANVLLKAHFWQRYAQIILKERQSNVINRLLEAGPGGFEGGLTNHKYAGMGHVSKATAQRELADLVQKVVALEREFFDDLDRSYYLVTMIPVGERLERGFHLGGTGLMIVVGVALDTAQQIESHLITRHYDGFTGPKGTRIRGRRSRG